MSLPPLLHRGPPTALVVTGDWRAVVVVQRRLEHAPADPAFVHLRGSKMRTAAGCFDELAAALQFPVWFGANWDALVDVVRDRGWLAGTVLAIYDAHELLADASERDRRNLAEILEGCSRGGQEPGAPAAVDHDDGFHVLAQVTVDERDLLFARWRDAGLTVADLAIAEPSVSSD